MPFKDEDASRAYQRAYQRKYRKGLSAEQRAKNYAAQVKWRAANPEKWAANKARWYRKHRKHVLAKAKEWARQNPRAVRDHALRRFGISVDEYDRMLAAQGGGCAICGRKTVGQKGRKNFHVDHCHRTKKVRGLLCAACNQGLGAFSDDPKRFRAAADYLGKE